MEKIYRGIRDPESYEVTVTVDGKPLDPRLDLRNHSPSGFEWGYEGSGPAQLALAILADYFGDGAAQIAYQQFKREFVAKFTPEWTLSSRDLRRWLSDLIDSSRETERVLAELRLEMEVTDADTYPSSSAP